MGRCPSPPCSKSIGARVIDTVLRVGDGERGIHHGGQDDQAPEGEALVIYGTGLGTEFGDRARDRVRAHGRRTGDATGADRGTGDE